MTKSEEIWRQWVFDTIWEKISNHLLEGLDDKCQRKGPMGYTELKKLSRKDRRYFIKTGVIKQ